jgi:predicted XRE-type DNA-binding protein
LIDFACLVLEWIGFVNYVKFYDGDSLGDDGEWVHTSRLERAMNKQLKRWKETHEGHQIDLATALGIKVPDVSGGPKGRTLRKRR